MLLGFIVSERGIEANPEKIASITSMGPIKNLKGVQRVMGCLAALSRFISRLGERGLPLYRLLRKAECFTWTPEAEEALGNLKAPLTNVPILVPPLPEKLAKIASGQTTVPPDVFSRDLHQPSIKIDDTPEPEAPSAQPEVPSAQSEAPSARPEAPSVQPEVPSAPEGEALRVEEDEARSRLIETGRPRTCNISTEESYPSTEPKLGGWHGAPSRLSWWGTRKSSTTAAPQASSSDASPSPKVRSSYERYTQGLTAITQHLEPLSEMPSDKVSTSRRRWPTPLESSAPAKGVSSTRDRPTCPLRPCRRYPSPGLLLCGVWTSSAPCRRHPRATCTCWSPSTNSPSGSRSDP
jgi:hypothetical protein